MSTTSAIVLLQKQCTSNIHNHNLGHKNTPHSIIRQINDHKYKPPGSQISLLILKRRENVAGTNTSSSICCNGVGRSFKEVKCCVENNVNLHWMDGIGGKMFAHFDRCKEALAVDGSVVTLGEGREGR